MLETTPKPCTTQQVSPSPEHAISASDADLRLQFCRDDLTTTADDTDATEVRVWDGELCLAAVTRECGGWGYAGGDCGHLIPDEHLLARFPDWRQALRTLTGLTRPPE